MPPSPKIPIPPGTSWDGRTGPSKFWGKRSRMTKMCPHVKPGGGQCGLEAKHCKCVCLLCHKPVQSRKRSNALLEDGTRCQWGQDRSPEVSTPEQESPPIQKPRRTHWHAAAYGPKSPVPHPAPSIPPTSPISPWQDQRIGGGRCLPNLEAGGPDGLPPRTPRRVTPRKAKPKRSSSSCFSLNSTPTPPGSPNTRAPATWNRTLFAQMPTSASVAPLASCL